MIWGAYGMPSATRASPDGRYVLVAVSFADQVQVIDAQTNAIVATVDVGDFPLEFAFNAAGDYAIVTNALGNSISVLHIQGESTAVATTVGRGQFPCRLAYNPVLDQIGIINLSSNTLTNVNPTTGDLVNTVSYATYGNPVQVQFDENGKPIVSVFGSTTPGYVIRDTQVVATTAVPCYFDYSPVSHRAAVACPGPDWVTLIDSRPSGVHQKTVAPAAHGLTLRAPSVSRRGWVPIGFDLPSSNVASLAVYDLSGSRVAALAASPRAAGACEINWVTGQAPAGVYFIRLKQDGLAAEAKVILTE